MNATASIHKAKRKTVRIVGKILAQMVGIITARKSNAFGWKVPVKQTKLNLHGCSK